MGFPEDCSTDANFIFYIGNRYIEVSPEDVIWANLGMNPYEQKVHLAMVFFFRVLQVEDVEWTCKFSLLAIFFLFLCYLGLTLFFIDTYSYQLRGDRCLDHFLVHPRFESLSRLYIRDCWYHSSNSPVCRYRLKHLHRLQDCSLPCLDMQAPESGCWYHLGMPIVNLNLQVLFFDIRICYTRVFYHLCCSLCLWCCSLSYCVF